MAPSRGLNYLFRVRMPKRITRERESLCFYSDFAQRAADPSNKTQVYISRTLNPYLNLSIEHYLLRKSPPDSIILFLYTNRPCVVIGRNQNPWVEVNLGLLKKSPLKVELVRRRSGGGTVFHDEGNVNYSVICPTPHFHRDKHAEMVVRALQKLGVNRTRVNERHDIVRDSIGAYGAKSVPLKVSGSAYKLTRLRSLHHGTCLLSSPNLGKIAEYLKSPAKPYIKAKGVESVSSPIANVHIPNEEFENAVTAEFMNMYGTTEPVVMAEGAGQVPEIKEGVTELKSMDWIFSQTPEFSFKSRRSKALEIRFTVRNGFMKYSDIRIDGSEERAKIVNKQLIGKKLIDINDWDEEIGLPTRMDEFLPTHLLQLYN